MLDIPPIKLTRKIIFESINVRLDPVEIRIFCGWVCNIFVTQCNERGKIVIFFCKLECSILMSESTWHIILSLVWSCEPLETDVMFQGLLAAKG